MAEALEMEVEDVDWFCYYQVCGWFDAANAWTDFKYTFSAEEKLALIDAGVTYDINWTYQTIYLCEAPEGYGETQATTTEATTTAPTTTR